MADRKPAGRSAGKLRAEQGVRFLAAAVVAGAMAAALHGIFGLVHWQSWSAYVVIGTAMAAMLRGGDAIWNLTLGRSPGHPDAVRQTITKIPFSFFAGGMGYVAGMLIAKKMFLIGFYDIPVKPLFIAGALLGCAAQIVAEIMNKRLFAGWRRTNV